MLGLDDVDDVRISPLATIITLRKSLRVGFIVLVCQQARKYHCWRCVLRAMYALTSTRRASTDAVDVRAASSPEMPFAVSIAARHTCTLPKSCVKQFVHTFR